MVSSDSIDGAHVARGADGEDPRRVAGRRDAAVLRRARLAAAVVSRGGDDDDPRADGRLAASVSGSELYDSYTPVATERFTTRMFSASLFVTT